MAVLELQDRNTIAPFFAGRRETFVRACLEGGMGRAYADNARAPTSAQLVLGNFAFLGGEPSAEMARHFPAGRRVDFLILTPHSAGWRATIEAAWGAAAVARERYATLDEGDIFDRQQLRRFAAGLPAGTALRPIDATLYHQIVAANWSRDLCANFDSAEQFEKKGLGFAAVQGGAVVAGAASYAVYPGGIEVEIDTREDRRRQGLALACAARLILECLGRDLYPSWDAQNKASLALAQKLGYHPGGAYTVYEVYREV